MRFYTVTGLVDEETGELYVAAVQIGRHDAVDTVPSTMVDGRELGRFAGFFDAENPDEAARVAAELVAEYTGEQAASWSPPPNRHGGRYIEDVDTKGKL